MAAKFEAGLEPAPHDFPEVAQTYQQPYDPLATTNKPEEPTAPSTYGGQTVTSPLSSPIQPVPAQPQPRSITSRTICGCSLLVFILSCIIAFLSAAVIALAAATGVESQRASNAVASLSATASASSATATGMGVIDDGCSQDPGRVNKTLYTSFSLLGALKFTRYCNRDAPHAPVLSLFTANFGTCMDACAAYTKYIPASFGNTENATCEAVSFIPAWTSKVTADAGGAPGNCYLKAGPQNESKLTTPNIGVDCHAAILTRGA